ncbi:MAG: fibronectin type III domain-containing protein [Patescibacteria group bacterium]
MKKNFKKEDSVRVLILVFAIVFFAASTNRFLERAIAEDASPPKISQIKILETNATSAVITWITDEPADSLLNYGLDTRYGTARDPQPLVRDHSVAVTELEPSTTYYFRVMSVDATGNQSISGHYSFTTPTTKEISGIEKIEEPTQRSLVEKAASLVEKITDPDALKLVAKEIGNAAERIVDRPQIVGAPELQIGSDQVSVRWETDIDANSLVSFATEEEYDGEDSYRRKEGDEGAYTKNHEVILYGLRSATKYHYQISSRGEVGPTAKTNDKTFVTRALLPQIFDSRIDKVEEYAVTVSWATTIPSAALVEYTNMRTGESKSIGNPSFLVSHVLRIQDLSYKTPYAITIKARNQLGEEAVSNPLNFTTTKDEYSPAISRVSNESTLYPAADAKIQTIVNWETDEPAACQLFYGQGLSIDEKSTFSLPENPYFTTSHVEVITAFAPSTVYKFWISCRDRNENKSRSEDFVLFTPQKEKNIIDIILENFQGTFGWLGSVGK